MTITALMDPALLPDQSQDQDTFDANLAAFFRLLPLRGQQENEMAAAINAALAAVNTIAAGGAFAVPMVYSSSVTVADPGARYMRLDNASPYSAGQLVLSTTSAAGKAITQLVGGAMSSTSPSKASVRISSLDGERYVVYRATAIALPTAGYVVLTVSGISSQGASFVNGETLLTFFQPTGDKGGDGTNGSVILLASATVSSAVANIDFLNIFSSAYDKYQIEIQGVVPSTNGLDDLALLLAFGGTVQSSGYYASHPDMGNIDPTSSMARMPITRTGNGRYVSNAATAGGNNGGTFTVDIRNVNSTLGNKGIGSRGGYASAAGSSSTGALYTCCEGYCASLSIASGFRLLWSAGASFTKGTIRVYGIRNATN